MSESSGADDREKDQPKLIEEAQERRRSAVDAAMDAIETGVAEMKGMFKSGADSVPKTADTVADEAAKESANPFYRVTVSRPDVQEETKETAKDETSPSEDERSFWESAKQTAGATAETVASSVKGAAGKVANIVDEAAKKIDEFRRPSSPPPSDKK